MRYREDGSPIPSGMPVQKQSNFEDNRNRFGVFKGQVIRTIYPEDPDNTNRQRVEYVVRVGNQNYSHAIDIRGHGGIYNYEEHIHKGVDASLVKKKDRTVEDQNLDGEFVLIMFLNGNSDLPIIIGAYQHNRNSAYKKRKRSDGVYSVNEFNGIEFEVDKDSNYTIKHVGRKSLVDKVSNPKILNPAAVNTFIRLYGNGDFEIDIYGNGGTSDLRTKMTKASKKWELYAQENKVIFDSNGIYLEDKNSNEALMNSAGILIQDKNNNEVLMNSSGMKIEVKGNAIVNCTGNVDINAASKVTVDGSVTELQGSSERVVSTGSIDPFISTTHIEGYSLVKVGGGT